MEKLKLNEWKNHSVLNCTIVGKVKSNSDYPSLSDTDILMTTRMYTIAIGLMAVGIMTIKSLKTKD